jgi:acetyl esterase/lipase
MSEELIVKLPPFVVCTREFDWFRQDAEYFAERLRKHNKLLELYIHPGSTHVSFFI